MTWTTPLATAKLLAATVALAAALGKDLRGLIDELRHVLFGDWE